MISCDPREASFPVLLLRLQAYVFLPLLAAGAGGLEVGSKACSLCHAEIAQRYSRTSMAGSSGKLGEGSFQESFDSARFSDAALQVDYRISLSAEGYRLEFTRPAKGVQGERLLTWFVGSGRVARSYVAETGGFLFQAPISYYTVRAKWDISPGYEQHGYINLTRAVTTKCLQCHASRLQPMAGTENRFGSPPFLEGGIGCERCHGPGSIHIAKMTKGDRNGPSGIVNPAHLDPMRRDSVCAQCHLTGAVRVARVRSAGAAYAPGELLPDYTAYFVWTNRRSAILNANSHFEKLQQSACKKASGDRLWCGTCHDPHSEPEPARRTEFYQARCQKCHATSSCKENAELRRKSGNDCTACHMPKGRVRETEHAIFTDHSIPRRPTAAGQEQDAGRSLVPFWKLPVDNRDLGLAYAIAAEGDSGLEPRAFELLQKAEAQNPDDVAVLIQMVRFYEASGQQDRAVALSERILRLDPSQVAVAVNLGNRYIERGRAREAMLLWQEALTRNPALTGARINLAVAQYRAGDTSAAQATLRQALLYDPDQEIARKLLEEIRAAGK